MTLPPDPGSLKTTSLQDQSDQISRAQLLEQEAAKLAGNVTAAPGTNDYVFAQKAADDARFYAGRQREDAQNLQTRYRDEKEVVDKYNDQVMHADKDHNGRSDFVQHQEAEAAAPFKALGAVGAGLVGLELTNEAMKMGAHPSAIFGHKRAAAALEDAKLGANEGPASALKKLATRDPIMAGKELGYKIRPADMLDMVGPDAPNRMNPQEPSITSQNRIQEEMAATLAAAKPFAAPTDEASPTPQVRPAMRPRNQSLNLDLIPTPRPNSNFFKQNGGGET